MALQIYRPDIVLSLPEFRPAGALPETQPTQREPRIEDDESRGGGGQMPERRGGREASEAYESVAHRDIGPLQAAEAAQIMTEHPVCLPLEALVEDALALFRDRAVRHIPLLNADGRISGIVSERDLLRVPAVGPRDPVLGRAVRDVLVASADTSIREIAATMLERRVGCVPVVDVAGHPVGIITRSDILRGLVRNAPLELWV